MDKQWDRYRALSSSDQQKILTKCYDHDVAFDWWDFTWDYWCEKLEEQGVRVDPKSLSFDCGYRQSLEFSVDWVCTHKFLAANPTLLDGLTWAGRAVDAAFAQDMDQSGEITFSTYGGEVILTPFRDIFPDYPEGITQVWDEHLEKDVNVLEERLTDWLKETKSEVLSDLEQEYEHLTSDEYIESLIKEEYIDITDDLDELEAEYECEDV